VAAVPPRRSATLSLADSISAVRFATLAAMSLTKRQTQEAKRLTDRIARGSVTREDWSNLAALLLIAQGQPLAAAIAAKGLDAFIATSRPIYEGHAFRHEDYKRIYDRVCAVSEAASVAVH
jgi:hypothetical protein